MTPDEVKPRRTGYGVGVSGWEVVQAIPVSEVGRMLKDLNNVHFYLHQMVEKYGLGSAPHQRAVEKLHAWIAKAEELEAMR